ncbi:HAD-IA family hydrolase [Streptomyces sp. T-3]|nr:HAD-IA family hydrolase [Streptomyces sp. T-3]
MTVKGVLFDFSGTLLRMESAESWLRAVLSDAELSLPEPELRRLAAALETAGALPGGAAPASVPDQLAELWANRDVDATRHRAAFTGLSRQVELPDPALHDALYDRHMTAAAWQPYPDAHEVLAELRERGIGVAIVSNIGWDLRPVFRAHGLDTYVDAYALSYEHGIQKPAPQLFAAACDALAVAPENALMVGDDRRADAGAAQLGCTVHFVDHLPIADRPDGLRPVLSLIK